jgi:hypothetical protein
MRPIPDTPIGFRLCHELEGLLTGIKADSRIVDAEVDRILRWRRECEAYQAVKPFSEIVDRLDAALADRVLTLDECEDLLFLVQKYTTVNPYFDAIRTGTQQLMGLVAGLTSDHNVPDVEVHALQGWIDDWAHLSGIWPYDECESLVISAMTNTLDRPLLHYLHSLSAQFPVAGHIDLSTGEMPPLTVTGICAVDPFIQFVDRRFVLTGESARATRSEIEARIVNRKGLPSKTVSSKTHYVVVCAEGNAQWAFGCFGRKVEAAYNLRRDGHQVQLIQEKDLWDALIE